MAVVAAGPADVTGTVRGDLVDVARRFATISLVGALSGALVVGVLGRLAMRLLAYLNPTATGVVSDDGFEIGQVTLVGSLQLAGAGVQFGLVGALGYALLRGLMVGPPWFRLASISLGPGIVAGAVLIDPEGVDFALLEPLWLAVGLFIALPTVYVALVSVGSERLLARRPLPTPLAVVGLALWGLLLPLVPFVLLAGGGAVGVRRLRQRGRAGVLDSPVLPWILRAALAVVLVLAVVNLVSDLVALS